MRSASSLLPGEGASFKRPSPRGGKERWWLHPWACSLVVLLAAWWKMSFESGGRGRFCWGPLRRCVRSRLFYVNGACLARLVADERTVQTRRRLSKTFVRLGRLGVAFSFRRGFSGFTGYNRESLGKGALLAVIAAGPLVSALGAAASVWTLSAWGDVYVWRVVGAAFLIVNAIVFLKSAAPAVLRGNEDFPEGTSDGLTFEKCADEEQVAGNRSRSTVRVVHSNLTKKLRLRGVAGSAS